MNWPNHSDYQDAMQNPQTCFQEPELQGGVAACDMLGLPRVMSGNFASVYELSSDGRRWAIRCFVRQVSGQQGRYARLSQYLASLSLDCLVEFEYKFQGIQVHGDWFPIVKMHWVEGQPLNLFLEDHYQETETLKTLAQKWREMLRDLHSHRLAHGDLQHGNVMVTPDRELRLVDYDGMYAPVFGRGRSPELGHANFQHPRRTPEFYDEGLDNFSALIIYASFLAVAQDPALWTKYYTGDNLIFSSSDFKAPLQSPLFQAMKQQANPDLQRLAGLLEKSCIGPVERMPDYEGVMAAMEMGTLKEFIEQHEKAPAKEIQSADALRQKLAATTSAAKPADFIGSRASPIAEPVAPTGPGGSKATSPTRSPLPVSAASASNGRQKPGPLFLGIGAAVAIIALVAFVLLSGKKNEGRTNDPKSADSAPPSQPAAAGAGTPKPDTAREARRLVDFIQAKPAGVLPGFSDAVTSVAFSRSGKWIATGGADKSIKVWDSQARSLLKNLTGASDALAFIHFLNEDRALCAVSLDNVARFYDPMGNGPSRSIEDEKKNLFTIVVSPSGQLLATGGSDRKAIVLKNLATGAAEHSFVGNSSWVRAVSFSPDGRLLASTCQDDSVRIWDLPAKRLLQFYDSPGNKVETPVFSPNNAFLATGTDNQAVKLWNVAAGKPWLALVGHKGNVRCFAFSPDSSVLASGSDDKSILLWNPETGVLKQTLSGHSGPVVSLAFSPDGRLLASGSEDHTARLWSLQP